MACTVFPFSDDKPILCYSVTVDGSDDKPILCYSVTVDGSDDKPILCYSVTVDGSDDKPILCYSVTVDGYILERKSKTKRLRQYYEDLRQMSPCVSSVLALS